MKEIKEIDIADSQILAMAADTSKNMKDGVLRATIHTKKSDSFGDHKHRTWVFYTDNAEAVGTIERYWGGLKMICSVLGGSPRTSFFTEEGQRTTNKGLKDPK